MAVGFQLSREDAISLLWHEYNPRCSPPWSRSKPGEVKDFERKVDEVLRTPGQKPMGWLLDEYKLRSGDEQLADMGRESAANLLASGGKSDAALSSEGWMPFPIEAMPPGVIPFIKTIAMAHNVDVVCVILNMLATIGTAVGNAFRLKLKDGYLVPPTLWCILVAETGYNKSGPLELITQPMWDQPPMTDEGGILSAGGQSQWVIQDTTVEAMIARLAECPRGLLLSGDELGQWLESFDAYKKGKGGDQQKWIRPWDVKKVRVDRKTDDERTIVHAPSVSIAGAIQPYILAKCTDAEKLASGFFARTLVAMPPPRKRVWSDDGVSDEAVALWRTIVDSIRTRSFAALNASTVSFDPNVVELSLDAKVAWEEFYERNSERLHGASGIERILVAKADTQVARIELVLYGLECALGETTWGSTLSPTTMGRAITIGEWFLNETLRVFQSICGSAQEAQRGRLLKLVERKGGSLTVRKLHRSDGSRYKKAEDARAALRDLAAAGFGEFADDRFTLRAKAA